nr:glyoxylate/hydroxypyruvate reductase A [uncultured Vibrio sp.]
MKSLEVLYYSEEKRGRIWQESMSKHHKTINFHVWPDEVELASIDVLVVWKLTSDLISKMPNLKAIFTVSAGIDQIDFTIIPSHVDVVRMIDEDLSNQLAEYAAMSVLMLYRRALDYLQCKSAKQWKPLSIKLTRNTHIGIMGLGKQGLKIIEKLKPFDFHLKGWSRSLHSIDGVSCYDQNNLNRFLSDLDILLCVLPLTENTKNILRKKLFSQLPAGCSLINIGRGEHLIEEELIQALNSGQIGNAILDVAVVEPLPEESELWTHPKVMVTPHIAGVTRPESGFESLEKSLLEWREGQKPEGLIDRRKGY